MTKRAGLEQPVTIVEPRVADLMLGRTSPKKVIHHSTCRHALSDYVWAREHDDLDHLARDLVASGAYRWHAFCALCADDVAEAVQAALEAARA